MVCKQRTFEEIVICIFDFTALTKGRLYYVFQEKVIAQTTAVSSKTSMTNATSLTTPSPGLSEMVIPFIPILNEANMNYQFLTNCLSVTPPPIKYK